MVKIQTMSTDDKTISSVITSEDGDEKILKDIALDNNLLKHWKFDYYEGKFKQTQHRFAFRSEADCKCFEKTVKESSIYDRKKAVNGPKVYKHKAK